MLMCLRFKDSVGEIYDTTEENNRNGIENMYSSVFRIKEV